MSFRRNRTFVVAWLTPLLVALAALALPNAAMAAETGGIKGTVTGEGAGALKGVEVCVWDEVIEFEECGSTGTGGVYEIPGLPAGEYIVEFRPEGQNFIWEFYENTRHYQAATPVVVSAGVTKSGVNAELEEGAMISGVVTAATTGGPVSGATVCAWSTGEFDYGCAKTGVSGLFTVVGLLPGSYEVLFNAAGTNLGLLPQAYSQGLVTVGGRGTTTTGINQALQPGAKILGAVRLAATGAPLAGVRVCITEAEFLETWTCLTSPASGLYGFIGLPQGSYKVAFSAGPNEFPDPKPIVDAYPTLWWNGASTFATATPIPVTPPTIINGVDAALGAPAIPVTPPPVTPVPPIKKKVVTKPLKCRKGTVKRKFHGKVRCVVRHKQAKHRRHHK